MVTVSGQGDADYDLLRMLVNAMMLREAESTTRLARSDGDGQTFTVGPPTPAPARCRWCGTLLTGRQQRFCSRACTVRQQNRDRARG